MTTVERFEASIKTSEEYLRQQLEDRRARLAWIKEHSEFFNSLNVNIQNCGHYMDIDRPPQAVKRNILLHFPGKWKKDYCDQYVSYSLAITDTFSLRLYNAPPPPSCKLIERTRIVPERTETYYALDCGNKSPEEAEE